MQATDLEALQKNKTASVKNKSKWHDPSMEADGKMYHCSGCKQKFNKDSIAKFCPLKNICRMRIHAQRVSYMEEQISSVLYSGDQLEAINAQLQQQNKLLIIYHDFLPTQGGVVMSSQVKHTHSHQDTLLSPYT